MATAFPEDEPTFVYDNHLIGQKGLDPADALENGGLDVNVSYYSITFDNTRG